MAIIQFGLHGRFARRDGQCPLASRQAPRISMIEGKTDDESFGKATVRGCVGIPSQAAQTGD
jgi:hypothetical protein